MIVRPRQLRGDTSDPGDTFGYFWPRGFQGLGQTDDGSPDFSDPTKRRDVWAERWPRGFGQSTGTTVTIPDWLVSLFNSVNPGGATSTSSTATGTMVNAQGQVVPNPGGPTDPNLQNLPSPGLYNWITGKLTPEQVAYITSQSATATSPALNTPANMDQIQQDTTQYLNSPDSLIPGSLPADFGAGGGSGNGTGSSSTIWWIAGGAVVLILLLKR